MGRSYIFECSKCGYRAKISGRAERGVHFWVETVSCRDCKELVDAITGIWIPDAEPPVRPDGSTPAPHRRLLPPGWNLKGPPSFLTALNRLPRYGGKTCRWVRYPPQCPVSPLHRVTPWADPSPCPRCGVYMEKSAMPYRLWD